VQARIVPAARGARWLAEGWRLFRAAPFGWVALAFTYLALTQGLALIPVLGTAAAAVLVPALTVGLMSAARAAAAGGRVELGMLFDGLRHDRRRQLLLGAAYLAGVLVALAGFVLADGEGVMRALIAGRRAAEAPQLDALLWPVAVAGALYLPVMMALWFSPPLCAWHGTAVGKALFFSFFACLLNWRAFLVYGLATAVLAVVLPYVLVTVLRAAGAAELQVAARLLLVPLIAVFLPTLYGSYYASYRDVFGTTE
jgi:hypothetical protein